jgi:hypothetical protein
MTHNHKGDAVFWFVIVLSSLALLVVASGCASQPRYEAAVQVESSGEQPVIVASFKLVN